MAFLDGAVAALSAIVSTLGTIGDIDAQEQAIELQNKVKEAKRLVATKQSINQRQLSEIVSKLQGMKGLVNVIDGRIFSQLTDSISRAQHDYEQLKLKEKDLTQKQADIESAMFAPQTTGIARAKERFDNALNAAKNANADKIFGGGNSVMNKAIDAAKTTSLTPHMERIDQIIQEVQ